MDNTMDDSDNISRTTWHRDACVAAMVGLIDGQSDGRKAAFQSSFDLGYKLGLNFGFEIGLKKGMSMRRTSDQREKNLGDPRNINCQFCLTNSSVHNVSDMHKIQQEKNNELLSD